MLIAVKSVIWALALSPLGWIFYAAYMDELGPDPGKATVDTLGLWALRLLLITLALRPLRDLTGKSIFIQVRRLLGLFTWFYATLHFAGGIFYVIGWTWQDVLKAFDERTYITLGLLAWSLMVPLGLTSNRWSQRRLGRRWKRLHQLNYPLAIFACLHFIWLVRSDYWQPTLYAVMLAVLLLWRWPAFAQFWRKRFAT